MAAVGIGAQQVIEIIGVFGLALYHHSLGHAAREHILAQPIAPEQIGRRVPHGCQPLQAEGQTLG